MNTLPSIDSLVVPEILARRPTARSSSPITIMITRVLRNRDDRDEKIKILMTRTAELEAPEPSSQGSGFITPRENRHMVEDPIDLNSPQSIRRRRRPTDIIIFRRLSRPRD